jgi:protocatechuate 3,4-dioxygenase beta subunit/tetratricopeptide (TPR) repeat protein
MDKTTFARIVPATLALTLLATLARADDRPAEGSRKARPRPVSPLQAQSLLRQRDWAAAAAAYAQIVRDNPDEGQHWFNYGFALHSLKRYDEAIKAADKAAALGFQPATALYNIACAHALLGHKDEAFVWLEKALSAGFSQDETLRTDSDLDALRDDARFKKLIGSPPEGLSREQCWRFDLDHLARRMEKVHYNLYAKVSREKFQAAIDDLKKNVGSLHDEEMAVGIQRILALVGDGHTTILWGARHSPGRAPRPRYPVDLYLYKEGLYVQGAAPDLAEIVGGKVVRIGNASAEKALKAVAPLCSRDNAMGIKLQAPMYLTNPAALSYLKLAKDMSGVTLVVKKSSGDEATVELKPAAIDPEAARKFVRANAKARAPEPISFKKNDDRFWYEYLPDKKMVYFQYNQVGNKRDETLEQFCGKMFAFINEKSVDTLVIDMRNNGGGNNFLNRPLIHGLIRCDRVNQPGRLFVLVGRTTFSAAMNGAVDIERNTNAIFVGEPTGSSPNFVGETNILVLPCSGVRLSCSSLYWQSSTATDRRTWIAPSLKAEPSFVAFASNRDPGLEAIFDYLADEQKFTSPPPAQETDAAKALIDEAAAALRSGKSTSDILTNSAFLPAHEWPRFRKLIRQYGKSSRAAITPPQEEGEPLIVSGRVLDKAGQPVKNAVIYVYHTSARGWYSDRAAHIEAHEGDRKHARLFGYLTTDDEGNFKLQTIRPAGYPDSDLPAHIHVEVERAESGTGTLVTEIQFDDDPRLTAEWRDRSRKEGFVIAAVETGKDKVQRVRAELRLRND